MLFHTFLVLRILAGYSGGVGQTVIREQAALDGDIIGKSRLRTVMKELQSIGAVHRVKNHFFLTTLGWNLITAKEAAYQSYGVRWAITPIDDEGQYIMPDNGNQITLNYM